jgi:molybdenum cofactor cytidylyltransferase
MTEIAAVVLAAGRSSRYLAGGGAEVSKLIACYRGEPIVRRLARAALASCARPVVVVTGHARSNVEAALAGLPLVFALNPDFASGLASSLRIGVAALPDTALGAVVLLGDMPEVEAETIDRIVEAFVTSADALAAVPVHAGRRGNPVLLGRDMFSAVARLEGDEGARRLLREAAPDRIVEVPFDDAAVTLDIDTPDDLAAARKLLDPATRETSR